MPCPPPLPQVSQGLSWGPCRKSQPHRVVDTDASPAETQLQAGGPGPRPTAGLVRPQRVWEEPPGQRQASPPDRPTPWRGRSTVTTSRAEPGRPRKSSRTPAPEPLHKGYIPRSGPTSARSLHQQPRGHLQEGALTSCPAGSPQRLSLRGIQVPCSPKTPGSLPPRSAARAWTQASTGRQGPGHLGLKRVSGARTPRCAGWPRPRHSRSVCRAAVSISRHLLRTASQVIGTGGNVVILGVDGVLGSSGLLRLERGPLGPRAPP